MGSKSKYLITKKSVSLGLNSKGCGKKWSKIEWTKIDMLPLGFECKGMPLYSSTSKVALANGEIMKKILSLRGNRIKGFSSIDII